MSNPKAWALALGLMWATAAHANLVLEHAQSAGVKRCLPVVQKISAFLVGAKKEAHGAHSLWGRVGADGKLFTAFVERNEPDYTYLASISVAPLPDGTCSAVYEQIYNAPVPCAQMASMLPGYRYRAVLNKEVSVYDNSSIDTAMIYLMPAPPNGCLMVKKEVWLSAVP